MKAIGCVAFASLLFITASHAELIDGRIVPSDVVTNVPSHYSHHGIERDKHGKILRSSAARKMFMKWSGYPDGRPGFQIDHTVPLKRNGPDCPCNMKWLSIEEKKKKDKIE